MLSVEKIVLNIYKFKDNQLKRNITKSVLGPRVCFLGLGDNVDRTGCEMERLTDTAGAAILTSNEKLNFNDFFKNLCN